MELLNIKEVVQAGDIFLIRFNCVYCNGENLNDWKNLTCTECKNICGNFFEFDNSKSKFRCLAGTKRKSLRFRKKTIRLLMEIQSNCCAYCDKELDEFHIDHVIPISFGGNNDATNLVLACPGCNLKAGSKVFLGFAEKRNYLRQAKKIGTYQNL